MGVDLIFGVQHLRLRELREDVFYQWFLSKQFAEHLLYRLHRKPLVLDFIGTVNELELLFVVMKQQIQSLGPLDHLPFFPEARRAEDRINEISDESGEVFVHKQVSILVAGNANESLEVLSSTQALFSFLFFLVVALLSHLDNLVTSIHDFLFTHTLLLLFRLYLLKDAFANRFRGNLGISAFIFGL